MLQMFDACSLGVCEYLKSVEWLILMFMRVCKFLCKMRALTNLFKASSLKFVCAINELSLPGACEA